MIVKYQKEQTVSQLKKAYSTLNQAIHLSEAENGPLNTWELPTGTLYNKTVFDTFYKYLFKYTSNLTQQPKDLRYAINDINGKHILGIDEWFFLNDGSAIAVYCVQNAYCWIFYDINGTKKPNKLARDVFMLDIGYKRNKIRFQTPDFYLKGKIDRKEFLDSSKAYTCSKSAPSYAGAYCGALIQYDNWKISDDYPW